MGLIDSIIGAESGGDPTAKNPNSSATGAGQFISSTWLDTLKAARPDLAEGKSDQEILALRNDPALSREMTEAYAAQNGAILSKAGQPVTPGTTYLAHFAGPQGAVGVLSADPSTPIDRVLTPAAINANPFLRGMTAGDLRAWADRKMGGGQGAPASPAAPAMAPPVARVASTIMGQPQVAPQMPRTAGDVAQLMGVPPQAATPQQAGGGGFEASPPMQLAPIQYAQRRAPDLSKLRALFKAPTFS